MLLPTSTVPLGQLIEQAKRQLQNVPQIVERANGKLLVEYRFTPPKLPESVFGWYPLRSQKLISTTFAADRLSIKLDGNEVSTDGTVRIVDPAASFMSSDLKYNWTTSIGGAHHVQISVPSARLRADSLTVDHSQLEVIEPKLTAFAGNVPFYGLSARKITIKNGDRARLEGAGPTLFGKKLFVLRPFTLRLDEKFTNYVLPSAGVTSGSPSIDYGNTFFLNNSYSLTAGSAFYKGDFPYMTAKVTYSLLGNSRQAGPSVSRSAFGDSYLFSYFENITETDPNRANEFIKIRRFNIGAETVWNRPTAVSDFSVPVSRPYVAIVEHGGPIGPTGYIAQMRYEKVTDLSGRAEVRPVAYGTVGLLNRRLSRGVVGQARVDGSSYFNKNGRYSWARWTSGIIATLLPQVRAAAEYVDSADEGFSAFAFDELNSTRSVHTRLDLMLGPTQVSWLQQYNILDKRWENGQLFVSQVVGAVQPYLSMSQSLDRISFGMNFRTTDLFGSIANRRVTGYRLVDQD